MAYEPAAFRDGMEILGGWDFLGQRWRTNPARLLTQDDHDMVRLWRICRPPAGQIGGMAAGWLPVVGPLPESGGAGEQVAVMLEAFDVMDAAWAELRAMRDGHQDQGYG